MSISAKEVMQAQAHIGTLKSEAHPKTRKYRADVQKGLVVINPEMIAEQIETAKAKVQKAKAESKQILVVCEKKMYAQELAKLGDTFKISYLNHKVPAGFLTNFETLKKRIESMNSMTHFMETEAYRSLTKKEQLVYKRKLDKVFNVYGGVKELLAKPDLIIVVDGEMMSKFVDELEKQKNIDSILICGTNFSRRWKEDGLIISNVISHKSLDFMLKTLLS
jgi:small subunit ribosomal protein S2